MAYPACLDAFARRALAFSSACVGVFLGVSQDGGGTSCYLIVHLLHKIPCAIFAYLSKIAYFCILTFIR